MSKSIVQEDKSCYFCGRTFGLEKHHIWAGNANRPISDRLGFLCWLCSEDHRGPSGAQYDKQKNLLLKQAAQRAFEKDHSRAEFMKLIGKNYL